MVPADFDERMRVLGPHLFEGVPLTEAAREAGVPRRTATRWLAAYRAEGSAGLSRSARSARSDRGAAQRAFQAQLVEFVGALDELEQRVAEPGRVAAVDGQQHSLQRGA